MIAHVVLFRPRVELPEDEREAFVAALEQALSHVPQIKRARLGRRRVLGQPYDSINRDVFPYAAVLEFDSEEDLRQYLAHPAHQDLGLRFYQAAECALAFDYDWFEADRTRDLL
ncbi:MAG: Dabb family protein [Acidobacteriota bacterium]